MTSVTQVAPRASRWRRYIAFWNEQEAPDALGLLRITFGLAVIGNVLEIMIFGDVVEMFADIPHGGIFAFERDRWHYSLFQYLPPTRGWVWTLAIAQLAAAVTLTLGLFSNLSAFVVLAVHLSFLDRIPLFRFSSDDVYSVGLYLMLVTPIGAAFSLDAAWRGKGRAQIGKWARRLFMAQLAIIYSRTGLVKLGSSWSFMDDWSAIYLSLNLPGVCRWKGDWAAWIYPLTQASTFVFSWWEFTFFVLPLNQYLRRRPRKNVFAWLLSRYDLRPVYQGLGVCMHLGILIAMDLGMFSPVMWSLYPAYLMPHEARASVRKLLGWVRPGGQTSPSAPDRAAQT
jgi:hypothetical protein